MVVYEFYWRDPIKVYQRIGKLPERRKSPVRITQESIINWGKKMIGENVNANDLFFIKTTANEKIKGLPPIHPTYKPLKELEEEY